MIQMSAQLFQAHTSQKKVRQNGFSMNQLTLALVGVQVFATFDQIPVFNSLTKSNLSLGDGITTAPVTLSLDLTPSPIDKAKLIPSLQVSAGLNIPVARSPEPLLFQMVLTATDNYASIVVELKGN